MMQLFDIQTGKLMRPTPPTVLMYDVVVKYADGHYTKRVRPDELDAFMKANDIQDVYEVRVPDPAWVEERRRTFDTIWKTSCLMPPEEDLRLTAWAKTLPPERYEEIHPEQGKFRQTRERLFDIQAALFNELLRRACLAESPTP